MSKIITSTIPDTAMTSFITAFNTTGAMYLSPGVPYNDVVQAFHGEIITKGLTQWIQRFPDSATATAITLAASSAASATALTRPVTTGNIEFTITTTNPASIANGSTGTCTVTLTLAPNPSWTGTVTFSLPTNSQGITATFSPTTRTTAGTTTATITVPSGVTPGTYNYVIIGTDGFGIQNSAVVNVTTT